jgi:hypothetical protein
MRDTAAEREAIVARLSEALALADELREAELAYLIERALDEARAIAMVPNELPPPPSARRP